VLVAWVRVRVRVLVLVLVLVRVRVVERELVAVWVRVLAKGITLLAPMSKVLVLAELVLPESLSVYGARCSTG
jgi:hypothetical protein